MYNVIFSPKYNCWAITKDGKIFDLNFSSELDALKQLATLDRESASDLYYMFFGLAMPLDFC